MGFKTWEAAVIRSCGHAVITFFIKRKRLMIKFRSAKPRTRRSRKKRWRVKGMRSAKPRTSRSRKPDGESPPKSQFQTLLQESTRFSPPCFHGHLGILSGGEG